MEYVTLTNPNIDQNGIAAISHCSRMQMRTSKEEAWRSVPSLTAVSADFSSESRCLSFTVLLASAHHKKKNWLRIVAQMALA